MFRVGSLLAFVLVVLCVETETQEVSPTGAVRYLAQYGYLPPANTGSDNIISEDTMSNALAEFQSFAGINITGVLDNDTAVLMATPRCGVKDRVGPSSDGRSKRYALQGSRWRVKHLTYRISKYPKKLRKNEVDDEIRKAFAVWSTYTDLSFTESRASNVHIDIRFEKGEHGDGDPFDGPGGTLAHAYFPVYGGDAHFDDAEQWTINNYRGTNLFQVAAHEFGHSLGLSHSDIKAALMAPFYRGYDPAFQLHTDDIEGIQALYGRKTVYTGSPSTPHHTTVAPAGEEDAELCMDPKVDAIFNSAEGHTYVFKDAHFWRLTDDGVASGYPRLISSSWKGLPGNIDAAFTYRNGKTYFFKGSEYWRYIGKRMDGEYPKQISEGFTGIPDNIDAATVWSGNGKIYFYKGTKFWRFDPAQRPPVKSTYPKAISNWEGLPDHLDAAVVYKSYTYFFKGNAYYRFNDRTFTVDTDTPAFPRGIAYWWFGCRSANKGTLGNVRWQGASPDQSFLYADGLDAVVGDLYDDDVGDIILDAGGTDEQLVTSSNQDDANSAAVTIFDSTTETWRRLLLGVLTVIIARFVVAT